MKLIVGLGNPGEKYEGTRHNSGFRLIDNLARKLAFRDIVWKKSFESEILVHESIVLAKPQTYMNASGKAVKLLVDFYKPEKQEVWIAYDDLDIRLGDYKISKGVGPKVHNGVNSIEESLKTKDFWHVRIGIDNRSPNIDRVSGEEYVLEVFENAEKEILDNVLERITNEIQAKLL